jgi:nucleotide-binding universal stress UspA family protein
LLGGDPGTLAFARSQGADPHMKNVIVAVDGSDSSVHALRVAHGLLPAGTRFVVVSVAENVPMTPPMSPAALGAAEPLPPDALVREDDVEQAVEMAEQVGRDAAAEAGVDVDLVIGSIGEPSAAILDAAAAESADLIALGTHHRGWLTRLLTDSVADEVRARATLPVLLVPPSSAAER